MEKSKKGGKGVNKDNKGGKGGKNNSSKPEDTGVSGTCNYLKARHILCEKHSVILEIYNALTEAYGNKPPSSEFAKYATEKSECSSKRRGGELGYFGRGKMHGDFEKVAFNLAIGEMSDIVKTSFGYHLILVEDRKATLK